MQCSSVEGKSASLYGLNLHLLLYGSKIIKLHLAFQCLGIAPPKVFTNINVTCGAILSVEYVYSTTFQGIDELIVMLAFSTVGSTR